MIPPIVSAESVSYHYPGRTQLAVDGLDLQVFPGRLVCIVGPNGCGKTTLLRMLAGTVRPTSGNVQLQGRPIADWSARERARTVAVVTQREEPAFPLRVRQTVLLGRHPHLGLLGIPTSKDQTVVDECLKACDCFSLSDRWVNGLSGGEWQRVRIARALAQEPSLLLLDEATSNLDVRHEMETFELTAELVHNGGLAGVMVTHHVNLASRFADEIVVMSEGKAAAAGAPEVVLDAELFERVFEWPVQVNDWRGAPQFVPKTQLEEKSEA